jgi:ABC-2 type transport system permease protein
MAVMKNEFLFLARDRRTLLVSLVMPALLLFLLSYSITNDVQRSKLGVYNPDPSPLSRAFLKNLEGNSPFEIQFSSNPQELISWARMGRVKAALFLPPHFDRSLLSRDLISISAAVEGIEPLSTRVYLRHLEGAIPLALQGVADDFYFLSDFRDSPRPYHVSFSELFNPGLDHFNFMVPALMGCILMSIIPMLSAISIVRERETGSFDRVLASPASGLEFLIGKLSTYFIIALFNCLILFLIGNFYFQIPFRGNIHEFFVMAAIFSIWAAAFGLLISTFTENQLTALTTGLALTLLPAFIFSGAYYPLRGMPWALRWIPYLIPSQYFVEISRQIYLKGNPIEFWWKEFAGLLALTLVTLFFLFRRFRRISEGPV